MLLLLLKLSSESSDVSHGIVELANRVFVCTNCCESLAQFPNFPAFFEVRELRIADNLQRWIVECCVTCCHLFFRLFVRCAKRCPSRAVAKGHRLRRQSDLGRVVWNDETGHFKWRDHVVWRLTEKLPNNSDRLWPLNRRQLTRIAEMLYLTSSVIHTLYYICSILCNVM